MFFLRSKPVKPINLSFDETMTNENCFQACKNLTKFNRNVNDDKNVDLSNTYNDLEVFESNDSQTIIDSIDNTKTFVGSYYLEQVLLNPSTDISELKDKQRVCKAMLSENRNFEEVSKILDELSKYEKSMLWGLKERTIDENRIVNQVFFQNKYIRNLNYNETFLTFYNYFKIMFAPLYGVLSPVIFIILPFIYLKYFNGLDIDFNEYWRIFRTSLFGGGGTMPNTNAILRGLQTARTPQQVNQTLRNASMRSNKKSISKMFSSFLTIVFYIQNVLNAVEVSKRTHETINAIHEKLNGISKFYDLSYKLFDITKHYLNKDTLQQFLPQLANPIFKSSPGLLTNKGTILTTYLNVTKSPNLVELLNYVGEIDYFVSCCKLINKTGSGKFCFTEYVESTEPYIQCNDLWHPLIKDDKVVTNSITLDDPRNMIITGPNAGGKSTFIKSITLSLVFSQTLGISLGTSMKLSPFKLINTYLNIPDVSGKESLFEAEMHRAREHIKKLENMPSNEFSFFIMDEIFSSTNPEEGISGGFAICERLGELKNSMNIITTHFNYLTKLTETENYKAYKIPISRNNNNEIVYNYKLESGVSDQFIALELLKTKGFDKNIVNRAQEVCARIGKEKITYQIDKLEMLEKQASETESEQEPEQTPDLAPEPEQEPAPKPEQEPEQEAKKVVKKRGRKPKVKN
tara:strand:- start:1098 stop:3161 length:2064 start_codon:yes stop_codon:yes gene_type:complete